MVNPANRFVEKNDQELDQLTFTFTFTIWGGVLLPYAEASSGPNVQPHT